MKIRRRSLILPAVLAFVAGVTPAFAQQTTTTTTITTSDDDHGGIGIGIEGGITRNTITGPSAPTDFFDTRTGTLVGVWIGGNKPGPVGFVGEFLYLFRRTGVNTGGPVSDVLTQHALEIPTLFRINFGQGSSNGIAGYAVVGPVFTINLQTSLRSGLNTDNFSSGDIGIMAGGGFEAYRIGVEVRGNWGQKRVTNSGFDNLQDLKNRSVEFVLKFRFN
jgi:hypothetical protein